jgi:hypothetical protein
MSEDKSIPQAPTPEPTPPAATTAPEQPPPVMLDMDKVRYWAGRGARRKNRPAYSLMAGGDLP